MDRLNSVCVVFTCLTFALLICNGAAITRTYFIAAVERTWDYAPTGYNNLKGLKLEDDSDAAVFTTRETSRIGRVYKKVLYREFEDQTFTTEKPHPEYLGLLGPVLKGEVGDTIKVHFKNNGSRVYSVHPHGVFYRKDSEGALYEDSTKGNDKKDDRVSPGGTHTYTWHLTENHAPANQDDNCITWVYHSHVVPSKDVNTGLLGIMLTCKKGALSSQGQQAGVDKEFIGLFTVLDENDSWLLDENIKEYCGNSSTVDRNDEDFMESNKMHAINGYFYGNLFGLDLCLGDSVKWHLSGIGNEVDIHTAYFHGQSFTIDGHRKDVASLLPATFVTATMKAQNLGQWMLNCLVNDHYNAGMYTLFNVTKCPGKTGAVPTVSGSKKRTYFIAANEIEWNYGPSNVNKMDGESLTAPGSDSAVFFEQNDQRIGGTYLKAIYEEYTDPTFTKKVEKPAYLGFLGPVIRAEVGDVIEVVFKNNANHNFSIQPHGVFYNKSNEGALYEDGTSGAQKADDSVLPGQTFTYLWTVPEEVGPTLTDAQCITWVYHSSVDPVKDTYSGLIGPLLTCKKGALNNDKTQKVKEFVLLFTVTDESESWYHEKNKEMKANPSLINNADEDYKESNKMHGINGYLYANLPGLEMCWGQAISWHLIGLGNEVDMHTAYFYGNTFTHEGSVKDTVSLLPGVFATLTMTPDNAGEWALVCRTNDHYSAGMQAKYVVRSENCANRPDVTTSGKVRRYYIAAVEIEWDYAPTGMNVLAGEKLEDNEDSRTFTENTDKRIGRKYKKVVYREYDAQFKKQMSRTTADKHLGVLGPMLHAEVGDTIEVVFKNKASRKYSMHPHGLYYSKSNEGSNYNDNTRGADKADNAIEPGKSYTYTWKVPDRAGPGTDGPACATWAYYSDVDPIKDTNSGLVGPLIICKKGKLKERSNDERTDVDREFVLLFTVLDENESWYLDKNIDTYCRNPGDKEALKGKEDFQESNKMHGINGYVFGNLKDLEMYQDEKVDWLLLGIGNEVDMHTVHFHGHAFLRKQVSYHREDVYDLFPGVFATVEMTPDSVGEWMLHCHVNDHMVAGMETVYSVRDKSLKPIPGTANSVVAGGVFSCLLSAVVVILLDA